MIDALPEFIDHPTCNLHVSHQISLDNGNTYISGAEAWPIIKERGLWDTVVAMMDDDIREQVNAELAPCSEQEFLERYLELATDLVIG